MALDKKIIRCDSMTTFSSVVGNITAFASEFFKGKFPPGYFKKFIISEELNSTVMENNDLQKYQYPYAVIRPELDLDNTFTQMLPQFYWDTHYIPLGKYKRDTSYNVLRDEERKIYIHCIPTRIKINFNVRIKVQTVMSMYNLIQSLRTWFVRETYEYLNGIRLQTELPKAMIINLAKYLDYDLSKPEDRELFAKYLNSNSMQGIEENINLSSGNSMYAFNYIVNILSSYPDSPQGNKNIKNLIAEDCTVDFPFSFDLWIPNRFLMEYPDDGNEPQIEFEEDNEKFKYNMVMDVHYILPKIENKHLLIKKSFVPDVNVEYDTLDFSILINGELRKTLDIFKKENALTEDIFKVIVMCGNKLLPREMYIIDYERFIVKTKFPMFNTTYTVLIYGDLEQLNQVANEKIIRYPTNKDNNHIVYKK